MGKHLVEKFEKLKEKNSYIPRMLRNWKKYGKKENENEIVRYIFCEINYIINEV